MESTLPAETFTLPAGQAFAYLARQQRPVAEPEEGWSDTPPWAVTLPTAPAELDADAAEQRGEWLAWAAVEVRRRDDLERSQVGD